MDSYLYSKTFIVTAALLGVLIVSTSALPLTDPSNYTLTAESIAAIFSVPATEEVQTSAANRNFTSSFYAALSKDDENIFFSPLGIHTVLSMLYQGASGTTKEALANSLKVPEPSVVADGYHNIITALNSVKNVTLHIANKAYLQIGYKLLPEFDTVIKEKFLTEVESVDFNQNDVAADTINDWVNNSTNGKIPTLFQGDDFDASTSLVLVNAIYFKGAWKEKFDKLDTRTERFFTDEDNRTDVQMMHVLGDFWYKRDLDLQAEVLQLPFNGDDVSMFVVLPFDRYGISQLEKKIQNLGVDKISNGLFTFEVRAALPKFKIETQIDLVEPLENMGLGELFNGNCTLTKMIDGEKQLVVSKAVQKAYIEVNEEGAEAAAVTGIVIDIRFGPSLPINFYANHPFLVVLKQGNNILFYGKIMKPVSGDAVIAPRLEHTDGAPPLLHNES